MQTLLNRRNDLNNIKKLFMCKLFISLNSFYTQLCFGLIMMAANLFLLNFMSV